jgi:hypothetical protein
MNKKQEQKEREYFEKMKSFIVEEITDGRAVEAVAGTINRNMETLYKYMREWGIKDLYGNPIDQKIPEGI